MPGTYPTFSGSYSYVHVSEDGPSLKQSDMKNPAHNVQWQNPGLHGFSLELDVAPHYVGLNNCMTNQNLGGSDASFTLSGCGISGLDGDYWIKQSGGNEIWVEKNNGWAVVWTNDASYTPEFCRTGSPPSGTPNPTKMPTNGPTKVSLFVCVVLLLSPCETEMLTSNFLSLSADHSGPNNGTNQPAGDACADGQWTQHSQPDEGSHASPHSSTGHARPHSESHPGSYSHFHSSGHSQSHCPLRRRKHLLCRPSNRIPGVHDRPLVQ